MSSFHSPCKDELGRALAAVGVTHWGVARAEALTDAETAIYDGWIAAGRHAGMDYLSRHAALRRDPGLLLESAASVVSCAIPYYHHLPEDDGSPRPMIAMYALGDDYHDVVRQRLETAAAAIRGMWGGETRVCVDTAPVRERLWAVKAGVGVIGRNNQLIVPGAGSYFFLGEILTTVGFEPDEPITWGGCGDCRRCVDACPGQALDGHGGLDSRRCLSYLTIEHRGELDAATRLQNHLYGCDECQRACPRNAHPEPATDERLAPRPQLLSLDRADWEAMTAERFAALARGSAIKRAKLAGFKRNLNHL